MPCTDDKYGWDGWHSSDGWNSWNSGGNSRDGGGNSWNSSDCWNGSNRRDRRHRRRYDRRGKWCVLRRVSELDEASVRGDLHGPSEP